MTEKLNPCPFCASETAPRVAVYAPKGGSFWIVCDIFSVGIPGCGAETHYFASRDEAIAAWNTRAYQATIDAERYRLLRRGQYWSVIDGIADTLRAEALDAAIDNAMTFPEKDAIPYCSSRTDGRCQQAIDYGVEGEAACPPGQCHHRKYIPIAQEQAIDAAVKASVLAEREACALVCEKSSFPAFTARCFAADIRARSNDDS
jgi:hypothetical protein